MEPQLLALIAAGTALALQLTSLVPGVRRYLDKASLNEGGAGGTSFKQQVQLVVTESIQTTIRETLPQLIQGSLDLAIPKITRGVLTEVEEKKLDMPEPWRDRIHELTNRMQPAITQAGITERVANEAQKSITDHLAEHRVEDRLMREWREKVNADLSEIMYRLVARRTPVTKRRRR